MALRRKTSLNRATEPDTAPGEIDPKELSPQKSPRTSSRKPRVALVPKEDPKLESFLDLHVQTLAPAPAKDVDLCETTEKVACAMEGLGNLESAVIAALFPTDGSAPQSFEEVARKLGMSLDEVKGLADNALRGLRGPKARTPRLSTVWN